MYSRRGRAATLCVRSLALCGPYDAGRSPASCTRPHRAAPPRAGMSNQFITSVEMNDDSWPRSRKRRLGGGGSCSSRETTGADGRRIVGDAEASRCRPGTPEQGPIRETTRAAQHKDRAAGSMAFAWLTVSGTDTGDGSVRLEPTDECGRGSSSRGRDVSVLGRRPNHAELADGTCVCVVARQEAGRGT